MGDNVAGGTARGRKRKRQVSWAAAELLEEVKVFHMAKPVNPSFPPPVVDDAGQGDAIGEDGTTPSGMGILGVPGMDTSSGSTPNSVASRNTMHPSALMGTPSAGTPVDPSSAVPVRDLHPALISGSADEGGGVDGVGGTGTRASGGIGSGGGGGGGGGSSLFKGFQTTETVVRRKKQALPPPPPPGTPPSPPLPGESALAMHRYPKDIWPGHVPENHADKNGSLSGDLSGVGVGVGAAGGGAVPVAGAGAANEAGELLEFFCDACDETIPMGTERMECAVCPDEFCLCVRCFDAAEILNKRHEHELLSSTAPFHITRAASSAEAAVAAAAALHQTESISQEAYDDDLG